MKPSIFFRSLLSVYTLFVFYFLLGSSIAAVNPGLHLLRRTQNVTVEHVLNATEESGQGPSQRYGYDVIDDDDYVEGVTPDSVLPICGQSANGTQDCNYVVCRPYFIFSGGIVDTAAGANCRCQCCNGQKAQCSEYWSLAGYGVRCDCDGAGSDSGISLDESGISVSKNDLTVGPAIPDCVETAWIKEHGFQQGILRERTEAELLCIPGLPCGTAGHLLRECAPQPPSCRLRTYEQVCSDRRDCTTRYAAVSRLRNSFDWSVVRINGSDGGVLTLTSLSVHPGHSRLSISTAIAYVADWLNSRGRGALSDGAVISLLQLEALSEDMGSLVARLFSFISHASEIEGFDSVQK